MLSRGRPPAGAGRGRRNGLRKSTERRLHNWFQKNITHRGRHELSVHWGYRHHRPGETGTGPHGPIVLRSRSRSDHRLGGQAAETPPRFPRPPRGRPLGNGGSPSKRPRRVSTVVRRPLAAGRLSGRSSTEVVLETKYGTHAISRAVNPGQGAALLEREQQWLPLFTLRLRHMIPHRVAPVSRVSFGQH